MKQTLVYGQQSCRLQLEGFPDVSAGHSPDALGIITSWTLDWAGRPQLEGRLDHLVALINVVLPYARYLMSGVSRPFGTPPQPVEIAPEGPGQHLLVLRSSEAGVGSLEVHLDDAELADLVRVLDSARLDPRLHLQPPLSQPVVEPLRRRELRQAEPLVQRLAAPVGGLAALALTAGLSSLAPLPAPVPYRAASSAATTSTERHSDKPDPVSPKADPVSPKPDPVSPKAEPNPAKAPNQAKPTSPPATSPVRPVPQASAGPSQPPMGGSPLVVPAAPGPAAPGRAAPGRAAPAAAAPGAAAPAAAPAPRPVFTPTPPSAPEGRP